MEGNGEEELDGEAGGLAGAPPGESSPGLEPALVALRVLQAGDLPGMTAVRRALSRTREVVVERLDARSRLWWPWLRFLVEPGSPELLAKLRDRLALLAGSRELDEEAQKAIARAREAVEQAAGVRPWVRPYRPRRRSRGAGAKGEPGAGAAAVRPPKKPHRPRAAADDPQLRLEIP